MARIFRNETWTLPQGDFAALRLTAEVFLAQSGVTVEVRDGGTIVGRQGSTIATCLYLIRFAPFRFLPKRVRIDVRQEKDQIKVQARIEDAFALGVFRGIIAGRYERYFAEWLRRLAGHVVPEPIDESFFDENIDMYLADDEAEAQMLFEASVSTAMSDASAEADRSSSVEASIASQGDTSEADAAPTIEAVLDDSPRISPVAETPQETAGQELEPNNPSEAQQGISRNEALTESNPDDAAGLDRNASVLPRLSNDSAASHTELSRRARLKFPTFQIWKRERRGITNSGGLPERTRREASEGAASFEAGAWAQSVLHYDSAILAAELEPELGSPESAAMAQIYLKRGLAYYRQSQAALGSPTWSENSISDFYIAIALIRRAAADYGEAIRLNPTSALAYCNSGEANVYAAQCERSTKSFRKASEDLCQAVADFTRAIDLEPALASAYAGRAIAHLLLQQDVLAKADVHKAVALGFDAGALQQAVKEATRWSGGGAAATRSDEKA